MLEIKQQVNLFIEALDGRFEFIGGCVGTNDQFFHRPKVAGLADLFDFIDGSHTPFTEHLHNFEFSIQDSS